MLKRLLLIFLLLAIPCAAQDLRPSAYVGKPGVVTVRAGKVQGSSGGVTSLASQDITPTAGATTYIYVNLSSTPVIATNTSGFPGSNYFPICSVITDGNGNITTFTDSRPDYFMAGGSGGTPGGSNTQVQYNNNGVFGGTTATWDSVNGAILAPNGSLTHPAYSFTNCTGCGMWSAGGTQVLLSAAGTNVLQASSAGISLNVPAAAPAYQTASNCAVNSASPAACGSATAGSFVVPTTTTTYTVNSSRVTTTSRIFLFPHTDTRDLPGTPTCVAPAVTSAIVVTGITNATSFTFALPSTSGQTCWDYWIVN